MCGFEFFWSAQNQLLLPPAFSTKEHYNCLLTFSINNKIGQFYLLKLSTMIFCLQKIQV